MICCGAMLLVFSIGDCLAVVPNWISGDTAEPESPAPVLIRDFQVTNTPVKAVLDLAVAGWCEVSVNGRKVTRDVLTPVTCQPDARLSALSLDITPYLMKGTNELAVLLGNGWWNSFTKGPWYFQEASWRGAPAICGRLSDGGCDILVTDVNWRAYDSPIVFNSLRNGEWYDARLEGERRNLRPVTMYKYSPRGRVSPDDAAPCRPFESFEPCRTLRTPTGETIYDFGANIAGWCEIDVVGERGAKVVLDYDESLTPSNTLLGHVVCYSREQGEPRPCQHDEYILSGRPDGEHWHPRFTFHGFRYAKVTQTGDVRIRSIRSRFVHSDFARTGKLETSDRTFAALQSATERSFLSNFVGIPTDCPHREKNGWTGDAQLAAETGLWNFEARAGYVHFLRMMLDAQAPNGAVSCMVPCTPKFGYGWGSGPAWDAALFEIPWQIFRFYGDDSAAHESYPGMKRYLKFILTKADEDGLFAYGLGDWCDVGRRSITSLRLTDSAFVYSFCRRLAFWGRRFGEMDYADDCDERAELIRRAFNRVFYKGNGVYASGTWTELAAPLYFKGLCVEGEEDSVVQKLVGAVRANGHRASFGILGAKWVPRVLAEKGYIDDAWQLFVQPEMPGWAHWLQSGDGTLREDWDDSNSHNHIMFGDLSAWAYEYVAGIVPLEPGFRKVAFRPHFPKGVTAFSAMHRLPNGEIRISWKNDGIPTVLECVVPEGVEVDRSRNVEGL